MPVAGINTHGCDEPLIPFHLSFREGASHRIAETGRLRGLEAYTLPEQRLFNLSQNLNASERTIAIRFRRP